MRDTIQDLQDQMTGIRNRVNGDYWRAMLGQRVRARSGVDGSTFYEGLMFSYSNEPAIGIRLEDGTQVHWAESLCEIIDDLREER